VKLHPGESLGDISRWLKFGGCRDTATAFPRGEILRSQSMQLGDRNFYDGISFFHRILFFNQLLVLTFLPLLFLTASLIDNFACLPLLEAFHELL